MNHTKTILNHPNSPPNNPDFAKLSYELKCPVETFDAVIVKLQEIEPAGLFSRNLKEATLFEKEKIIFLTLKSNMLQLNLENKVKLLNNDFFNITLEKKAFNLVYLDPPYHQNLMDMAINKILDEKALKKTSILVCETKKNHQFNKELHKFINLTKTYGKTSLTFFKFY